MNVGAVGEMKPVRQFHFSTVPPPTPPEPAAAVSFGLSFSDPVPVADRGVSVTFINPTNISSNDCSPHFTRLFGSGLDGFSFELSNPPVQKIHVPAASCLGSLK